MVEHPSGHGASALGFALVLLGILTASSIASFTTLPPFSPEERAAFQHIPPRSIQDVVAYRNVLKTYTQTNPYAVTAVYGFVYMALQTLAIPGTIFLSILAGSLWGVRKGLTLVSIISTIGSCACYALSHVVGRRLVYKLWPEKVEFFAKEVARRHGELFNYIIFLRVTPLLPNTFINVASPIVGVPLLPFALGTLAGCLPNNFVAVSAGSRLSELKSLSDLTDPSFLLLGLLIGCIALIPVGLKHRHEAKVAASGCVQ